MSVESVMPFNHLILCRPFSCPQSFPESASLQWIDSSHQVPSQIKKFPGYFLCSGSLLFFTYIFFLLPLLLVLLVLQFLLFTSLHCLSYFCFHHYYLVLFSCTSNITTAFMLSSRHPGLEINVEYYCTLYNTLHTHTHNMPPKRSFGQKDYIYIYMCVCVCVCVCACIHTHLYMYLYIERDTHKLTLEQES